MLAEDRITRGVKPKRTRRAAPPSAEERDAALRRLFGMQEGG